MCAGFHVGELTSANTAPESMIFSTALSVDPFINGEHSFINPSSCRCSKRRESAYAEIITQLDRRLRGGAQWCMQRIENLDAKNPLRTTRGLRSCISYDQTGWEAGLTRKHEFVLGRVPVVIQ